MRQNLAAGIVDGENGKRNIGAKRRCQRTESVARELLQIALKIRIDGQPKHALGRRLRNGLTGGMRRQDRHGTAPDGTGADLAKANFIGRHHAGCGKAVEHPVPRGARRLGRAVRPTI